MSYQTIFYFDEFYTLSEGFKGHNYLLNFSYISAVQFFILIINFANLLFKLANSTLVQVINYNFINVSTMTEINFFLKVTRNNLMKLLNL